MKKEKLEQVTIRMKKSDWELFKQICEARGTKASVKIREIVNDYIRDNKDILNELIKGEQK